MEDGSRSKVFEEWVRTEEQLVAKVREVCRHGRGPIQNPGPGPSKKELLQYVRDLQERAEQLRKMLRFSGLTSQTVEVWRDKPS